ncbi:MerR family transcriptional regulator [Microbacterium sp. EYE_5]|uniref:MerR family transcriptional regulator n=1 Tax=unclassified Microbacterium TaxID=2609290 RepID=UPI0020058A23|nr:MULTISPECIES: MerR family transcriptional regulator [unclassified Microbacterium]MCK6079700.1 MerR family transcriptional regulator [Microbacterium sp. EYE_382]MCK6084971.1 MerR family transcriptional regulator [Microbacterium sp. EYE_384]MCK6122803.1 MerR family transcriptional regulator [Microbacterium sp. EYE_80]MCK6125734.1 MerR family transcriptional regulator [Microbacterium sp. EYE_79]MCK6140655.1 MerR family transcriptional regulator [Microbacterium sp. EYE_39]
MTAEWSIQQLARLAGTTSRALRHYGEVGILAPARVGANGYRYYDAASLRRLQRILLLRELGVGLPQIADVLARDVDETTALASHLAWLQSEQHRISRQIAAVASTIDALEKGEEPMPQAMFDGFDHTEHEREVTDRWGADAYARGDAWWRGLSGEDRAQWKGRSEGLARAWADAAARGIPPESPEAQDLAARHVAWLTGIPGTPAADGGDVRAYVLGLADMYVADGRFGANYGGPVGAEFVRAALRRHYDA